jgi:hypothetical protein
LKPVAAESLDERRDEAVVELESEHALESGEQRLGERAAAGTDLEDPRGLISERPGNSLGHTTVNEEILTEAAAFRPTHDSSYEF